jgi:hypothetical protein
MSALTIAHPESLTVAALRRAGVRGSRTSSAVSAAIPSTDLLQTRGLSPRATLSGASALG